ncbi:glycosyltransferase involved in cell wall biosynthesis [Salinibacter ruber]|uniref:glycosyltransferase family 4 protein n=1 Tax=Salinibacter ruber TaxID=146919 RepID=UPI0013C2B933|nr:glycosyltransferase family 4 protein [Salinibacter ruber]MCS3705893.1 glycosyltransferase involved in cell wall biosynthesis [Salinibacter ruber]
MEEKRLALVCQHFYPEMVSTGMHMTELSRRLREYGWKITVYCAQPALEEDENKVPADMTHQGIRIKRMPTIGEQRESTVARLVLAITYLASTVLALLRDRREYDGLLMTTNPPFIGLAGWLVSKVVSKPYVQLVYDVYPDIAEQLGVIRENGVISKLWEFMTRITLNAASGIVVIGRNMNSLIQEKIPRKKYEGMHIIPNWADETVVGPVPRNENPFRQEHDVGDQILVQYAGRHGKTHNLEPLVGAAIQLTNQPILFQFIGGGDKKEKLRHMAQKYDLDNVSFLPYQPRENLDKVLAAADVSVVCLDSRFTGMSVPSKTYGIMASGTPILGFLDKDSEIGRTVEENDCGYILEDPTSGTVAQCLRSLVKDRRHLNEMGACGRKAFEKNYTLEAAAERYDKVLCRHLYGEGGEPIQV